MLLAITKNGARVRPSKEVEAFCPCCEQQVIAKMGQIRIHYWAHLPNSECSYGTGMTEWHYRWIHRHFDKDGWEVEHPDDEYRYDCFNSYKGLVLEIQKTPLYEYMIAKTEHVTSKGYSINWILHDEIFREPFIQAETYFEAKTRRRLLILDILQYLGDKHGVNFYVDSKATSSKGRSSKGLLKLHPKGSKQASYSDYYTIHFTTAI
jgi:competence CoiA-like predicted nuclease